ncbi:MAG TPA: cytochrome c oxidase subunit 3 [Microvirga sp.]|jgi:cytochrome c oxidase subunit 3|nr:cytochrome c oxidase subunit 3 [Microvirga sp.]
MGVTILFFSGIAVVAVWWLSTQRITSKPWLEQGTAGELRDAGVSSTPVAKIGLGVLLAAIGSLFALFISAYLMRMQLADWRPVPKPTLLWANTGVLMLSSAALQWVRTAADRNDLGRVRAGLLAAAGTALLFVAGQLLAWGQLDRAGYFLTSNPASSFFYLITGLHGLHVLGGMVALGLNVVRAWHGRALAKLRLGLDLCSLYWDFLLVMWLVLFGLLLLS